MTATLIKPSRVMAQSPILRWKSQLDGVLKVQGVFTLRDREGFPIDMAYEVAKERGWVVDWVEAMADAARQGVAKYDALLGEIKLLEPDSAEMADTLFICGFMSQDGEDFRDKARALHRSMWESN